ncbi:MAG: EamA family transporter [Alphaproteobacteria bacterium]|nr:EamA family transporter [Alphaproteobacteria bacterium]
MKFQHSLAAILVAALWGINFGAAKYGMEHFPPLLLTCFRFSLVALFLLPFARRFPAPTMKRLALLALTLGTMHFGLMFTGLAWGLDVSTAAIASQLGVPFSCLLGAIFLSDQLGMWRSTGLMISFVGIMLIAGTPDVAKNFPAFMLTVAGAMCWAASNIQIKKLGQMPVMRMLFWMALFSAPMLLVSSLVLEGSDPLERLRTVPLRPALGLLYTVVFSTLVAYGLWYWLMARFPITQVAPYSLLVPVFGVATGVLAFGDEFTWFKAVGAAVTMTGVAIIVIRRPRTALQVE